MNKYKVILAILSGFCINAVAGQKTGVMEVRFVVNEVCSFSYGQEIKNTMDVNCAFKTPYSLTKSTIVVPSVATTQYQNNETFTLVTVTF